MYHQRFKTAEQKFWEKVDKRGECWLWTAAKSAGRYGAFGSYKAHRFSWELANGPIPRGMNICHKCDIPLCVNPAHLFLGTQKDNMQDCARKGRVSPRSRAAKGEKHPLAKLTTDDVLDIRWLRGLGVDCAQLAQSYGVSGRQIRKITSGERWSHV